MFYMWDYFFKYCKACLLEFLGRDKAIGLDSIFSFWVQEMLIGESDVIWCDDVLVRFSLQNDEVLGSVSWVIWLTQGAEFIKVDWLQSLLYWSSRLCMICPDTYWYKMY